MDTAQTQAASTQPCPNGPCRYPNAYTSNLALPPDQWPSTVVGADYEQFAPLDPKCPDKDDYFIIPPRLCWYFRPEGGALHRDPSNSVEFAAVPILLQSVYDTASESVLSTSQFNYDFAAAGNFLIGHQLTETVDLEGSYLVVAEATNTGAVRSNTLNDYGGYGNLFSPFSDFGGLLGVGIPGLDYNNYATIDYKSSLQGAELNLRRHVPMVPEQLTVSILFGVRYVGLPEELDYYTSSDITSAGTIVTNGSTNSIHVRTTNEMVGPQIGALFEFYADNRWWINFEMKGAVMNNHCREYSSYTNIDDGVTSTYTSSQSGNHTSFAGEFNLTFLYRWSPHFNTRIGYRALFLTSTALAADNFNTNIEFYTHENTQLNHNTQTVYHGPFAGIEFGW